MKRSRFFTWLTCLSLLLSLSAGIMITDGAHAQPGQGAKSKKAKAGKISSDLRTLKGNQNLVKVIIQFNTQNDSINSLLSKMGAKFRKQFKNFNTV
ncbi:MAG TPA: hypothetical protein VGO69_05100, partial [Pyrinomonadaceae bacterium]|nr:hypothetical protein [Pyrinomonadaceae bacterium]